MPHGLRYSNPGYVEAVVLGGLMNLAQRPGVPREGMGERGSKFLFRSKIWKFIYLNQEQFNL